MLYREAQGVSVPALGLGTWRLMGGEAYRAVRVALELGFRHVDTARIYENEEEVGRALQDSGIPRSELFVTTKLWYEELSRTLVQRSAEESLRRLRCDYLDLLLIHWPNPRVPLEETLEAMLELKEQGKVRLLGVSNFPPSLFARALTLAPLFTNQVEFHPYLVPEKLLRMAEEHGVLLTAYSPLARGRVQNDPLIQKIAGKYGKTPAQITLRWLLDFPGVIAIPKASTPEHLKENLALEDFTLSPEDRAALRSLARGLRLIAPSFGPRWEEDP